MLDTRSIDQGCVALPLKLPRSLLQARQVFTLTNGGGFTVSSRFALQKHRRQLRYHVCTVLHSFGPNLGTDVNKSSSSFYIDAWFLFFLFSRHVPANKDLICD
jgi:hypothetical protein